MKCAKSDSYSADYHTIILGHSIMFDSLANALSAANPRPQLFYVHSVLYSSGTGDRGQGREASIGSGEDNNWGMDDSIDVNAVCMFVCEFRRMRLRSRHGRVPLQMQPFYMLSPCFLLREGSLYHPAKAVHFFCGFATGRKTINLSL